ncbi:unnamed protein product [Strongylus vulgaris]|uniref:Aminopeptidase N-like N-terminal domain-containing protein n=1 Tax=Strongylus vulgaris TaxID=40348 RepID=A0A3P7K0B4_STRVU|nr:unnamed protein product [Strongylus vulgaris]
MFYQEKDNDNIGILQFIPQAELEMIEILPGKRLEKGKKATLKLVYSGLISKSLGGFYQTNYVEKDGTKKVAAVTQMAPIDARSMVPCFDEPEFKATWNVTVIHPKGTKAISNGIEENE